MSVAAESQSDATYLDHFRLADNPFRVSPSPRYTYLTPSTFEALEHARTLIAQRLGLDAITGEIGTGKTTLYQVIAQEAENVAAVAALNGVPGGPRQTDTKIYRAIAEDLGLGTPKSGEAALKAIKAKAIAEYGAGRTVVVLVDEAHLLKPVGLAALKNLLNFTSDDAMLVQVILFGQLPEMLDVLRVDKALHTRLAVHTRLNPLARTDVKNMLEHRVRQARRTQPLFSSAAVDEVYKRSAGIPRVICTIADRACTYAFQDGSNMVDKAHVTRAAEALLHEAENA